MDECNVTYGLNLYQRSFYGLQMRLMYYTTEESTNKVGKALCITDVACSKTL